MTDKKKQPPPSFDEATQQLAEAEVELEKREKEHRRAEDHLDEAKKPRSDCGALLR